MHSPPRALRTTVLLAALTATATGLATPPGAPARGFVEGANHHLGDAGFVAQYGRAPGDRDAEAARMHTHLAYVRALLASRPATRPELAARRTELLAYLDDYIAARTTPWNTRLPWRTPVFVDDYGNVCAVGYLIERTEGRALVDRIARAHRYDYLEDIAMPEVQSWIERSGFTLEELASIQPGYVAPAVEQWQVWNLRTRQPHDGPFAITVQGIRTTGAWRHGEMEGHWTRSDEDGHLLGSGEFHAGSGRWQSTYANGVTLAEGAYVHSLASGTWRFFHESGRPAAQGALRRGDRVGPWRFLHDDVAGTPIAQGAFERGDVTGTWRHYDARGGLIATSWESGVSAGERGSAGAHVIRFVRGADGLEREVIAANIMGDGLRLESLRLNGQRVYVWSSGDRMIFDANGSELVHGAHGWTRARCDWSRALLRAAAGADLETMSGRLMEHAPTCTGDSPLSVSESARVDAVLAPLAQTRVATPEFVRRLVLDGGHSPETDSDDTLPRRARDEMTDLLADHLGWYVEWPHIDGRFARVFATLPDHFPPNSLDEEDSPIAGANLYDR